MNIYKSTLVPTTIDKPFAPPYGALHAFHDFNLIGKTLFVAPYYAGSKFSEWQWLVSESERNDEIVKTYDCRNTAGTGVSYMAANASGTRPIVPLR